MPLKLYNTLTRRLETFKPLRRTVRMYTCGPTVYDYAHLGNLRTFVNEDVLRRYLKYRGFRVKQVRNITDVDDKTIRGARAEGLPLKQFTAKYTKAFFEDVKTLNIEPAEVYPKATEHIKEMVALIRRLLKQGVAYVSDDGSVYYSVSKFKDYGKLSRVDLSGLIAGARVAQDTYEKEEAKDFALWKAWTPEDGDVFWTTSVGKGRPGWHIECSAMSMKYLGQSFDVHSGGKDLIFPHHENEIAQSEGATGKRFVRHWFHTEHLLVDGKKMSKSLGNFYTLRDVLGKGYDPRSVRYLLLSAHYRAELNFTFDALKHAAETVKRIDEFVARLKEVKGGKTNREVPKLIRDLEKDFETAMDDDLNIPEALASLFEFVRHVNRLIDAKALSKKDALNVLKSIKKIDRVLSILPTEERELPEGAKRLMKEREELRRQKNFAAADAIRKKLLEKYGVEVQDTPEGPKWRLVK